MTSDRTKMEHDEGQPETKRTCRAAHADNGNANCTGVCQRKKGHSGKHKDQHGHEY